MRKHPPEEAIVVIGSFLIMSGAASVAQILFYGTLNLGFLALPIGYGLLQGSSNSRAVVLVLSGLGLLMALVIGVLFALRDLVGWKFENLQGPETWRELLVTLGAFATIAYMFFSLRRDDVRKMFENKQPAVANPRPWLISVSLVTVYLIGMFSVFADRVDRLIGDLYPYHVRLSVFDKQTGDPLESIGLSGPELDVTRDALPQKFQQVMRSYALRGTGNSIEVTGLADRPLLFDVQAENYEPETIRIRRRMGHELRVELTPIQIEKGVEQIEAKLDEK